MCLYISIVQMAVNQCLHEFDTNSAVRNLEPEHYTWEITHSLNGASKMQGDVLIRLGTIVQDLCAKTTEAAKLRNARTLSAGLLKETVQV